MKHKLPVRQKKNLSLTELNTVIDRYDRFILTSHIYPEGDSIGSVLAMHSLLTRMGKHATIISHDPIPERWLPLASPAWNTVHNASLAHKPQAIMMLDVAAEDRLGDVSKLISPDMKIFNIDHHISNTRYGDYVHVQEHAASTGEVIWSIMNARGLYPTAEEARWIYATLLTDTGWFRYGNTNARVLTLAAELAHHDFSVAELSEALSSTWSMSQLRMLSAILKRARLELDGALAWSYACWEDFTKLGLQKTDVERVIDFLRYIGGVRVAFFMAEVEPGRVTVSLRTRSKGNILPVAERFGGGGHREAAGFTINASIEDASRQIIEAVQFFEERITSA